MVWRTINTAKIRNNMLTQAQNRERTNTDALFYSLSKSPHLYYFYIYLIISIMINKNKQKCIMRGAPTPLFSLTK